MLFVLFTVAINIYFFKTYQIKSEELKSIKFSTTVKPEDVLVYLKTSYSKGIDFNTPIKHKIVENKLVFDVSEIPIRTFRIYIGVDYDDAEIDSVQLVYENKTVDVTQKEFNYEWIKTKQMKDRGIKFSNNTNAFFEYRKENVTWIEFSICEILCLLMSCIMSLLFVFASKMHWPSIQKTETIKQAGIALFLLSVFLPAPLFNIAFMVSFAALLYKGNYKTMLNNKVALLLLIYFAIFLISNLFFSQPFNYRRIETYLPVLLLPFYFGLAPKANYLKYFPSVALLVSFFLILMSTIDTFIHHQLLT